MRGFSQPLTSWAANRDAEPAGIADVEAELDRRNEGLPFRLVQYELEILARGIM